jgi:hypothetical protein
MYRPGDYRYNSSREFKYFTISVLKWNSICFKYPAHLNMFK